MLCYNEHMMNTQDADLLFLKLGGSLITDKTRPRRPRLDLMARLASEIVRAKFESADFRLVLGHGSGSFGHVPAREYGTRQGVDTPDDWRGFAKVWYEAAALNRILMDALDQAGLPGISFPVSGAVTATLIVATLTVIFAGMYAVVVPVWVENAEADHMRQVSNDFTKMKKNIDSLIVEEQEALTVSSTVTLQADPTNNWFGVEGKRFLGELTIDPYSETFNLSNAETSTEVYGTCQGAIYFQSMNQQYTPQKYVYSNGQVIRVQEEAQEKGVTIAAPEFTLYDELGNRTLVISTITVVPVDTVVAASVLFIYKKDVSPVCDSIVLFRLEKMGLQVIVKDDTGFTVADTAGINCIVFSPTVANEAALSVFKDIAVPALVMEFYFLYEMGMTDSVKDVDFGVSTDQIEFDIMDLAHPIAAGLADPLRIFTDTSRIEWGKPSAGGKIIAAVPGEPDHSPVFCYEKGAAMIQMSAPAKRATFLFWSNSATLITDEGWQLFENTLNWLFE